LFGDLFADELACDMDFTRIHYNELARLVLDPRGSGKMLSLPGVTVKKEHGRLVITRADPETPPPHIPDVRATLELPGVTRAPGVIVSTTVLDAGEVSGSSLAAIPNEGFFDRERLAPPLIVRFPEPGDRIQPFGMSGTKKLSDIFIDKKIPAGARPTSLVITDLNGILWLVGVATSETCRVRNETREVVKIRVERTGEKPWPG
jgi:tRNA(Ile)-lysidine synthase